MHRQVFIENGVAMRYDAGSTVWSFDGDLWGRCVQDETEPRALARFEELYGPCSVMERIEGDERSFARDRVPATDAQRRWTRKILSGQHDRAIRLLRAIPVRALDFDDPDQQIASYATWRTPRLVFWHIADTESRYYIPRCGLPDRDRLPDLEQELMASHAYAMQTIDSIGAEANLTTGHEEWTSVKLFRRLAYHERVELDIIEAMVSAWSEVPSVSRAVVEKKASSRSEVESAHVGTGTRQWARGAGCA